MIDNIDNLLLSLGCAFPLSSNEIHDNGIKLKNEFNKFLIHTQKDSAVLHFKNRDKTKCIYQHIVEFPEIDLKI